MMLKNESKVIERCLDSIKNLIDYYVIVDTGSSDDTIEKVKSSLTNLLGEVHQVQWVDFGFNRNQALAFAKDKADYAILLDADMIANITNFDKEKLNADAYHLRYLGDLDYSQVLLINNRIDWKYVGVTHEYLHSPEAKSFDELKEIKINHLHDGANRKNKFERDIALLLKGIEQEPENSRYHFYLANSYRDIGNYERAAIYYYKRAKMGGWEEEVFQAIYQLGYCNQMLGKIREAKHYYLQAWEYRPTRIESLYKLVVLCRMNQEYRQAYMFAKQGLEVPYSNDLLFVERPVYEYALLFEKSICAYWLEKYQEAYEDCKKLTTISSVPENIQRQNILNSKYSEQKLQK